MQTVAKCLGWIGFVGTLRIAWLAQYIGNASDPTKNRIVILSLFSMRRAGRHLAASPSPDVNEDSRLDHGGYSAIGHTRRSMGGVVP